jgi:Skp family chaperone for outer membrane proteins
MAAVAAVTFSVLLHPLAVMADPAQQKIATVDLEKVFDKFYKTQRSNLKFKQEATDMEKERNDMVAAGKEEEAEWQKLVDKAEDQAVSADERAKSKQAAEEKLNEIKNSEQTLQEFDRASAAKLREENRERRDDIVKEIRGVLDAQAKAAGYTLVLDVSGESANMAPVVIYSSGANDMTDSLIKELNAGAPPVTDDSAGSTNK